METRAHYIMVGSFVLGSLIAAILFVLWMTRFDFGSKTDLYEIYFEGSVTGLRVNEEVRYHGIPIGKVKEINVDPKNIDLVRVRVAISEIQLMREDIVASVESQGLTGYSYIQIQGGSTSSPLIQVKTQDSYPIIPSQPSKIDLLFSNSSHIFSSVYELSEQLNELFDEENREEISHFIKNLNNLTEKLTQGQASIQALISEAKLTLSHIRQAVDTAGQNVHSTLDSFSKTADHLQNLFQGNQQTLEQTFYQLPRTLQKINSAADQLSILTREFEHPLGLLSKSTDQGYSVP